MIHALTVQMMPFHIKGHYGLGVLGRWVVEDWSACSKTCGKLGYQSRGVQCMQALNNGTNRPVHTKYCMEERPEMRRTCNRSACPAQWRTGAWSQVGQRRQTLTGMVLRSHLGTVQDVSLQVDGELK